MVGEVSRVIKLHVGQTSTPAIPDVVFGKVPCRVLRLTVARVTDETFRFTLKTQ